MFINPCKVTRVTSGFRGAGRKDHHGVDFANPGTHEIYAVADGTVSRSYRSTSYGEVVFIIHILGGQVWETVYAHMREGSRRVKEGQRVKQGQVLGIMGNTGQSTGQHLHFELHRGRWNAEKSNAVDPLDYLGVATSAGSAYIVKSGDTLSKIADQFNTTVANLKSLNNIADEDMIYPGDKLKTKKPTTVSAKKKLILPKTESSWRVYPVNKKPVKGNEKGKLNPKKFGGLEYEIIGNPQKDVYTIKTGDFGVVNIYAGPDTDAKIK